MTRSLRIRAAGAVDEVGVVGTVGTSATWAELGVDPRTDKLPWKSLFPAPFPNFRHLDRLSRALCIAAESAGLVPREVSPTDVQQGHAPGDDPGDDMGLVFASELGCLDADLRFARSVRTAGAVEAGLFPYTLPSTCLGELAIRYGLRGPSLCLSLPPGDGGAGGDAGDALSEAAALIEGGEAAACLVGLGDWVGADVAAPLGLESRTAVVAFVLEPGDPDGASASFADLLSTPDPVCFLTRTLRRPA